MYNKNSVIKMCIKKSSVKKIVYKKDSQKLRIIKKDCIKTRTYKKYWSGQGWCVTGQHYISKLLRLQASPNPISLFHTKLLLIQSVFLFQSSFNSICPLPLPPRISTVISAISSSLFYLFYHLYNLFFPPSSNLQCPLRNLFLPIRIFSVISTISSNPPTPSAGADAAVLPGGGGRLRGGHPPGHHLLLPPPHRDQGTRTQGQGPVLRWSGGTQTPNRFDRTGSELKDLTPSWIIVEGPYSLMGKSWRTVYSYNSLMELND